ncbi:MAG: STAS domain-containing protein [Spirochaetes bacterium]|nr:STAS domain-containing protein [Spirochaetota bacterium]
MGNEELTIYIDKKETPEKIWIFYLNGYLQANTLEEFKNNVESAFREGIYNIIFDCHKIKFASSAALGALISFLDEVEKNNGKLIMVDLSEPIADVFELLEFFDIFPTVDTIEEALSKFNTLI